MTELNLVLRFGVALVIGFLVGMQREYAFEEPEKELFGGVRTFALLGLIGCTAAFAADMLQSPWPFAAILLVVGAFLAVSYYITASEGDVGMTTEASAIVVVLVGALAYWEQLALAVALGVVTTALLSIKLETQRFVEQLTREDIYATVKFAIISAVILPVLPNQDFGPTPFDIFNPYQIWLLVVFISGISFVGYVLIKIIGPRKGIGVTGFLGGLASSTAVTLSFTQRSQTSRGLAKPFALAIIVAWTVMFLRVIVEAAALNVDLVNYLWPPILASVLAGLAYGLYLFFTQRYEEEEEVTLSNPFNLSPAIKFGLIFVVVLLISRAGQVYFGDAGVYISSFVSGLADVDAIALSLANLSQEAGGVDNLTAARGIILAAIANTLAKGSFVLVGGSPELRRTILPGFLLMMATAAVFAFLI